MNTGLNIAAGLHLFTSNRMETLVDHLAERLQTPLASPLRPETIVVRNKGMERWLKQELARRHRICANVRFPFPEAYGHEVFRTLFPELPAHSSVEREMLSWRIMGALPVLLHRDTFTPLRLYLEGSADERKVVQLSARIANLFDQYVIFRPEMIADWDAGAGTDWQPVLWRAVAGDFKTTHAAALWKRAGEMLRTGTDHCSSFPERLSIFGVSALPPFYLDLFAGLAQQTQVNLFLLQPSQEYWGDITSAREGERILRRQNAPGTEAFQLHLETGNRLLASMGYLGRDFLKLLLDAGDWISHEDFAEPGEASLLRAIQSDILHLHDRGKDTETPVMEIGPSDTSIGVHACHSPLREMEVLHDQMLDWFQHDPALVPRDIVVMTPDIEIYAPFIHAVFGSPEDEARAIPFTVADRGARGQSQVVDTFLRILDLPGARFGATTVLGLLETPAVRERFSLTEGDLALVRNWIEETNIRWGIDANHRARLDLPKLDGNTWRHGLNRLLLGYSLAGHDEHTFLGTLPYDDIEGQSAGVLGHFAAFVEKLIAAVQQLEEPRPLQEWSAKGHQLLRDFFAPSEDAAPELQSIRDALNALAHQQTVSGYNAPVSLAALIERLRPVLEEDLYNSGFLTGAVTFCGLKPMRSIPFQIVCLVGMNDNTFPRPTHQLSFDLMAQRPRLGDRSTREDDRYLFLETILSARERLHLSYVGQSIRDNSAAPPSVLISELLDYVSQGFCLPGAAADAAPDPKAIQDRLVTKHRLQAFSEDYFKAEGRLFSYSQENCRASDAVRQARAQTPPFLNAPLPPIEPAATEIRLDDLIDCFMNPARYFLQHRLQIVLPRGIEELTEREPFLLEGLERHAFRQKLTEQLLDHHHAGSALERESAAGTLPLGAVGEVSARQNRDSVEAFVTRLRPFLTQPQPEPMTLDLRIGEHRLTGTIALRNAHGPLLYRCAKLRAKDQLRAWITHLAASATQPGIVTTVAAEDTVIQFQPPTNPAALLQEAIALFVENLAAPLRFFPESALAFAEAAVNDSKRKKSSRATKTPLDKALDKWNGQEFPTVRGEKDDAAFALCFREADPLDETFQTLAQRICVPLIEHRLEVEA